MTLRIQDDMRHSLSSICEYRKGKISVSQLSKDTYISTENMLPNKCGITSAASMPGVTLTQEFKKGDVLVSNIRPYFKKIWQATFDGGCSNDVLVLKPKPHIIANYLYYVLSDDAFFAYSMATSKGTKMPRGDKVAIMNYAVPNFDEEVQVKIANILRALDNKIELNNTINNNLEQQAQALFKSWFVDFSLTSGVMPSNWRVSPFGSIARISTEVFSPAKNPNIEVELYSIPAYDERRYPVFEVSDGIKSNKYCLTSNSVIISKLNPDTKRIWRPYCITNRSICSTEFIVYEPINPLYRDFIYSIIDSVGFSAFLCSHTTGSTNSRQRATPSITLNYDIVLPDEKTIRSFCAIVSPMYEMIENNIIENQKLAATRDKLLPKLMSGEQDVSKIDF